MSLLLLFNQEEAIPLTPEERDGNTYSVSHRAFAIPNVRPRQQQELPPINNSVYVPLVIEIKNKLAIPLALPSIDNAAYSKLVLESINSAATRLFLSEANAALSRLSLSETASAAYSRLAVPETPSVASAKLELAESSNVDIPPDKPKFRLRKLLKVLIATFEGESPS